MTAAGSCELICVKKLSVSRCLFQILKRLCSSGLVSFCVVMPLAFAQIEKDNTHSDVKEYSVIADVMHDGSIILDSGEAVFLHDICFEWHGKPDVFKEVQYFEGECVVVLSRTRKNRWGEVSVTLELQNGRSFANVLVEKGLAYVHTGENPSLRDRSLLQKEEEARRKKVGMWQSSDNLPVPVYQTEKLLERKGLFTLVEGKVLSVGKRRTRTYLNFGRNWKQDFTVVIPGSVMQQEVGRDLQISQLQGKKVRIRGILDEWNGPLITLYSLDMLEILE